MTNEQNQVQELIEEAVRRSAEVFPEGENHDYVYSSKSGSYFYFPGIFYFRRQTITPDMIHRLQTGGNMLSIGSGDGHLERLLSGFNIPKERLVVSDISLDPDIKKHGFRSHEFDMTSPWPLLDERFDYILFPQSLGIVATGPSRTHRYPSQVESDTERILRGEEPENPEFYVNLIGADVPDACRKHEIMREAMRHLNPDGEIRVCYGFEEDQQRAYAILKLRQEHPGITFPPPNEGENFTIRISGE